MRSPTMKYKGLKFLMVSAFVIAACAVAVAENGIKDSNGVSATSTAPDMNSTANKDSNSAQSSTSQRTTQEEDSTTLEQRMQKTISVDFINTPIEDVVKMIAEQADVDIIKSPTVTGNVTAKLTNVPLGEALDNILAIHGYGRVINKNVIRVSPLDEIAQKEEILETRVYQITYADISDVESALKKFISKRGSISCSPGTSNIIVKDSESNMKAIDSFIEKIDRVTPQVLVEVRIYDISSTKGFNIDANWTAGLNNTQKTFTDTTTPTAFSDITEGDTYTYKRTKPFVGGDFVPSATGGGSIRLAFLDKVSVDIVLDNLSKEVGAKLLANPRILVLDNETANFKIVRQIPYQEKSSSSAGDTYTVKFKDVGTELKVTPHVTRDGMVRLNINPEFGVQVGSTSPPTVDTRKMDTKALVKDGTTVVLGGLRKREVTQEVHKVALLGDIPILGSLFSGVTESVTTSELLIFITPMIVTEPTLSSGERQGLEATKFNGPKITYTRSEKTEMKSREAGK
jgi:type IV pilus assembly protein PilQ